MRNSTGSAKNGWEGFLEQQGIPLPEEILVDETPPEPVDEEKLRAFHERELDGPESEWVAFLISRYRAWHEADLRLADTSQGAPNGKAGSVG